MSHGLKVKSIFYKQLRLGSKGKTFTLYKFRTMKENANDTFKNYLEKNNEAKKEWENNQKLFYDPRITKLGWFLREYSLDELPQFINVFLEFDADVILGSRFSYDRYTRSHNYYNKILATEFCDNKKCIIIPVSALLGLGARRSRQAPRQVSGTSDRGFCPFYGGSVVSYWVWGVPGCLTSV